MCVCAVVIFVAALSHGPRCYKSRLDAFMVRNCTRWPNLALFLCLFCIIVYFSLLMHICFWCIRFSLFCTTVNDWLGRTSIKWPVFYIFFFVSGMPCSRIQCRHDNNASPKHMVVVLRPGWVEPDVSHLCITSTPPPRRPARLYMYAFGVSSNFWWSKWHSNGLLAVLIRICMWQKTKRLEPSCLSEKGN